jgi:uncharacterized protein (DUF1800 family)
MKIPRLGCLASLMLAFAVSLTGQEPRLVNVSTLTRVGTGGDVLIAGFGISGTTPKQVLIRAVGPRLATAPFSVQGTLANPLLTVFNSSNVAVASNDNWLAADAAAFGSVGAFALNANSQDAAVVTTLPPGTYSAQVSGVGGTTGLAIVEVYEMGLTGGKFTNLSTRAQVGGAAGTLTTGFVVSAGGGTRKLLIRAAGPALTAFSVPGVLANPTLTLLRTSTPAGIVATNDDWGTPVGTVATAATLTGAFSQAGAFAFPSNSRDAALLLDLEPGNYTAQVTGVGGTAGVGLIEVYDLSPAEPTFVSILTLRASADETGSRNGEYVFTRTGHTFEPLTVRYGIGGSAVNGADYLFLSGSIVIPAGATSVSLPLLPNPDLQTEGTDTVVVTVLSHPSYVIGAQSTATVTIADAPATLYVANIRPDPGATSSTASGTATILLSNDGTLAAISISVSNLSSPITSVHLRISPSGDFVFNLPYQSSGTAHWLFSPSGNYSSADLLAALRSGNIYVGFDTSNFPQGEVRGTFVQGAGSRVFTAPATPPGVALNNVTAVDAARFLTQATFGPKKSEIDALTGQSIDAWLNAQLAMPFSSHRAATLADHAAFGGSASVTNFNAVHPPNRQSAWWKLALTAPDQLRQRVAFALSEIFVVSDTSLGDDSRAEPLAHYYDILGAAAFGNFRTFLEDMTRHPMMAEYLSSLRNAKADAATGTTPDENYAREIMQLFTIGLVELQPDGTLVLGDDGLPIPTYNQKTITEMAKVFTGWAYPSTSTNPTAFRTAARNFFTPLQLFPAFHEDGAKDLSPVLMQPIPANQGGVRDLQIALDALFNDPNTAPFISRRLIQRLVTSNPSPAYVYRVAQKFADNGAGVRGDMAAVTRAILTDYEARSPVVAANPSFGKLKEPILRLSGFLRAFNATPGTGRYSGHLVTLNGTPITSASTYSPTGPTPASVFASTQLTGPQGSLAQAALRSPTVFNFFSPDYVLPGPLATAGLVAPEFEITDDTYATLVPNFLRTFVFANNVPAAGATPTAIQQAQSTLMPDLAYEQTLVTNVPALLDHLNLVLAGGALSAEARTRITAGLAALPANTTAQDRARSAILLVLTAPNAAIQR